MAISHQLPVEGPAQRPSGMFSEEMFVMTYLRPHSGLMA